MAPKADVKLTFPPWIEQHGLVRPIVELQFHRPRLWRFDFAWALPQIALEMEGGVFGYTDEHGEFQSKGAHSSIAGILRDIDKYNAAQVAGWTVLRVVPSELFTPRHRRDAASRLPPHTMDPGEATGAEETAPQEHVPGEETAGLKRPKDGPITSAVVLFLRDQVTPPHRGTLDTFQMQKGPQLAERRAGAFRLFGVRRARSECRLPHCGGRTCLLRFVRLS